MTASFPLLPQPWPNHAQINALVDRGDSQPSLEEMRERWTSFIAPYASFPKTQFPFSSSLSLSELICSRAVATLCYVQPDSRAYEMLRPLVQEAIAIDPFASDPFNVPALHASPAPRLLLIASPSWGQGRPASYFARLLPLAQRFDADMEVWWDASLAGQSAQPLSLPSQHPAFSGAWAQLSLLTGDLEAPSLTISRFSLPLAAPAKGRFASTWLSVMDATALWRKYRTPFASPDPSCAVLRAIPCPASGVLLPFLPSLSPPPLAEELPFGS